MPPVDDLTLPDTPLAHSALEFARGSESPAVFNHSVRTYLYGRLLGAQQRIGGDYNDELLFLGAVLHDVGLTSRGNGEQRFEVDGADLAASYLREQGLSDDRVEVVWDAIALHTSPTIASRKRPEIALVSLGAGFDLSANPGSLPPGYADRVHAQFPRLRAAPALYDAIVRQARERPPKAPPFTFPGELLRQETGAKWPTWRQLVDDPGWGDYS